jgi:hypothetical protein
MGRQKAISRPFPQAIPNIFGITKEEEPAPCRIGCPAETNVQGYVALAAQEKWAEAFHLLKERLPFPGTLGRICNHPCELKCNRKDIEEPLAIREIKRFIADHYYAHPELESEYQRLKAEREQKNALEGACYMEPFARDSSRGSGHKVAVIGAGPAGLTAASDLAKLGYTVEIFEAESEGGGMMRSVIPDFRRSHQQHFPVAHQFRLLKQSLRAEGTCQVTIALPAPCQHARQDHRHQYPLHLNPPAQCFVVVASADFRLLLLRHDPLHHHLRLEHKNPSDSRVRCRDQKCPERCPAVVVEHCRQPVLPAINCPPLCRPAMPALLTAYPRLCRTLSIRPSN